MSVMGKMEVEIGWCVWPMLDPLIKEWRKANRVAISFLRERRDWDGRASLCIVTGIDKNREKT